MTYQRKKIPLAKVQSENSLPYNSIDEFAITEILQSINTTVRYVRTTVIIICFASFVGIIALWNSIQSTWVNSRIKVYEYQMKWRECLLKDSVPAEVFKDKLLQEEYYKAKEFFDGHSYKYFSDRVIEEEYLNVRNFKVTNVLSIKIPIVGVVLDINDLGMFGGGIFAILLFIYLYLLLLKQKHIKIGIKVLTNNNLMRKDSNIVYLFALNQVFMMPTSNIEKTTLFDFFKKFFGSMPDIITGLPLMIQIAIIIHDILTLKIGKTINYNFTISSLSLSFILFVVLLILTFSIIYIKRKIDILYIEEIDKKKLIKF